VANGEAFETVARLKAADGGVRHYLYKAEPHRDADGTVSHWFGSSTDVADRMAAERHNADLARIEAEGTNAERALSDADAGRCPTIPRWLPVLVVSCYADLESLSPSFPHLSKPFRQAELAAALEKVTA
jgi:hypothetical protein